MDEIDRISRDYERTEGDGALRDIAHGLWVYYAALIDEGFEPEDAMEITLSWQTMMMVRNQD